MKSFNIIAPYGVEAVTQVYKLKVKDGKLKIDKDLILILDSFEELGGNRYNASFLKSDGTKCFYKNFFIDQRDLENWIKSEKIQDKRKKSQRMEVEQ